MGLDLKTKFENIDVIFKSPSIIFKAEPKISLKSYKEFDVQYLKDNTQEIDEVAKKINTLFSSEVEDILNVYKNNEFKTLHEKMELLSEELESVGTIKCTLRHDAILIEIYYKDAIQKEFIFKEEEYLDSLLDYLENSYKKVILKG